MPLHSENAAVLGNASSAAIVDATASLMGYIDNDRWVGLKNVYRKNTVSVLKSAPVNEKQLREYIAASVPIHCLDGWSYLSRALMSVLSGDSGAGRHLAYYAELRAALALMAANGIGIFQGKHYYVEATGAVTMFPKGDGTHAFAWDVLEEWASTNDVAALLGASYTPFGMPLGTWLGALPRYGGWQPVAKAWLLAMGLDLSRMAHDRESRNEVSYRPTRLLPPASTDVSKAAKFATDLWSTLEPANYGPSTADAHLLRRSFEQAFRSVEGVTRWQAPVRFNGAVAQLVSAVLEPGPFREEVQSFLVREVASEDLSVLRYAESHNDYGHSEHPLEVLARASLLLGVATGSCRSCLQDANVSLEELEFWWQPIGGDRGLWPVGTSLADIEDQWADIANAMGEIEEWSLLGDLSTYSFVSTCAPALTTLGRLEVAPLWRLAA